MSIKKELLKKIIDIALHDNNIDDLEPNEIAMLEQERTNYYIEQFNNEIQQLRSDLDENQREREVYKSGLNRFLDWKICPVCNEVVARNKLSLHIRCSSCGADVMWGKIEKEEE